MNGCPQKFTNALARKSNYLESTIPLGKCKRPNTVQVRIRNFVESCELLENVKSYCAWFHLKNFI